MRLPCFEITRTAAEADVASARGSMGRRPVLRLLDSGEIRVEDEEHLLGHLEEDELPRQLAVHLKPQHLAIEAAHRFEVAGIKHGLENPACAHQAIAAFCFATSSPMPLRASARSSASVSSEKGSPSAVPWISTMPPDPVMTKLASVPAEESSG